MKYPYTPIRINNGRVYAWVWNGWEATNINKLPIYRLRKPKIGHSKNGRLLSYPARSQHVMVMEGADND